MPIELPPSKVDLLNQMADEASVNREFTEKDLQDLKQIDAQLYDRTQQALEELLTPVEAQPLKPEGYDDFKSYEKSLKEMGAYFGEPNPDEWLNELYNTPSSVKTTYSKNLVWFGDKVLPNTNASEADRWVAVFDFYRDHYDQSRDYEQKLEQYESDYDRGLRISLDLKNHVKKIDELLSSGTSYEPTEKEMLTALGMLEPVPLEAQSAPKIPVRATRTPSSEVAAAPAHVEAPRTGVRAEAVEHPEAVTTGNLKDGLTFTAEKGSDAERRVRIEDIVKGEDRKSVLTSTRYEGKEFKYDAARDSFYESAGDGKFSDQRLVILSGDVIKKKEVSVATEPVVEAPKEPASTQPAKVEPVADAPAVSPEPTPEPTETVVVEPEKTPEKPADSVSIPFEQLPAKTREFTRSLFGLNRSLLEASDRTEDLQSFSDKLQKALSDKYGVQGADFDLIEAPTPWLKKAGEGFEARAKLDFAILDSKGVQVKRVSFEADGKGEFRKGAQNEALKTVFAQIWDANNKGRETRYFNGAKVS